MDLSAVTGTVDERTYQKGIKVTVAAMLDIAGDAFHPE
jgi:hypothetical protein